MITIYTKKDCGNCEKVKAELDRQGIKYQTIDVMTVDGMADFCMKVRNRNDLPVVVIGGVPLQPIRATKGIPVIRMEKEKDEKKCEGGVCKI